MLIEWPERAERLLPADRWEIDLEPADDPLLRHVSARGTGAASSAMLPTPPAAAASMHDIAVSDR